MYLAKALSFLFNFIISIFPSSALSSLSLRIHTLEQVVHHIPGYIHSSPLLMIKPFPSNAFAVHIQIIKTFLLPVSEATHSLPSSIAARSHVVFSRKILDVNQSFNLHKKRKKKIHDDKVKDRNREGEGGEIRKNPIFIENKKIFGVKIIISLHNFIFVSFDFL